MKCFGGVFLFSFLIAAKAVKVRCPRQVTGKKQALEGGFCPSRARASGPTVPPKFAMPRVFGPFPELMSKQVCVWIFHYCVPRAEMPYPQAMHILQAAWGLCSTLTAAQCTLHLSQAAGLSRVE